MKLTGLLNETGANAPVFNKQLTSEVEIIEFCHSKLGISKSYLSFNGDSVDVGTAVDFRGLKMDKLPFKFGKIKGHFTANNSDLSTLENFPDEVDGNVNIKENKITSLHGCPKRIGGMLFLGDCHKITSLEGISEELGALSIRRATGLKSLHNIHKHIMKFNYTTQSSSKSAHEGAIMLGTENECYVEEAILGIFLIPGIRIVKAGIGNITNSHATFGPWEIINRHLFSLSSNEHAMYDCQEELYSNGFKDFAKL